MKSLDQLLEDLIDPETSSGPTLSELTDSAARHGFRPVAVQQKLFPLFSSEEMQKGWANWSEVSEREEIRLRLLALNKAETIHESLIPFLIFFFRSSDSLLYQTAAQIIGKHLPHHPSLKKFFEDYLHKRKIDPSAPFNLDGLRGRRRILVALAAFYVENGADHRLTNPADESEMVVSAPIDYKYLKTNPPANHLDLSATMLALSILLKKNTTSNAKEATAELLHLPGNQDVTIWDRNVIRNWGILLNATSHSDIEKRQFFSHFLDTGLHHVIESESYSGRLQALFELDEIIKSAVFIAGSEQVIRDISEEDLQRPNLLFFCRLRFNQWTLRETEAAAPFTLEKVTLLPIIQVLARFGIQKNGEIESGTISELFQSLTTADSWRFQPMPERVLRSFFLLDFGAHTHHIRQDELQQMITAIQADNDHSRLTGRGSSRPSKSNAILDVILQRLLNLEQTARGRIADGRLMQKITDENLLLALLPTETDSELLPNIADAFEHRIRLLLAADRGFNVDHYIYKINVREPHQSFYRYMKELTLDRPYGVPGGAAIDLSMRFDLLLKQSSEKANTDLQDDHLSGLPFWQSIQILRKRLKSDLENDNLFELADRFNRELEGTGAEKMGEAATLHDLINITQAGSHSWLRSGFPATWEMPASMLNQKITEQQKNLQTDIQKLRPASLQSTAEAGEAAQRIKEALHEAGNLLCPSLGKTEARIFKELIQHVESLLTRWTDALNRASNSWNRDLKAADLSAGQAAWRDLFKAINSEENSRIKMELFSIMLSSLLRPNDKSAPKTWYRRFQILSWAAQKQTSGMLTKYEQQVWQQHLTGYWKEMLISAKDENLEARVVQLVKAEELEELRHQESVQPLLREIKKWCFERYDLNHAYICNRELYPESNIIYNRWKTAKEYFTHFSYVWLAIIVGVIMMFDFGDPWTELAEIGDIGGVIFTFVLGVGGTYLYVFADLRKKVTLVKGDPFEWVSQFGRVAVFLCVTLLFTVMLVLLFYYMFSSTEQVVEGPNAIWHIMSWTGFALFVGVFFGLIGKS